MKEHRDYEIGGFLFGCPIWIVAQNPVKAQNGTWSFGGFANCNINGHLIACLFTDADLAKRHMEADEEIGLAVGEISTARHLINLIQKLESAGFRSITFDADKPSLRVTHQFPTAELIATLQGKGKSW
jgi:hypothetical protein